jgi:hypothetical protein
MADIVLTNPRFEISLLGHRGVEPAEVARPGKIAGLIRGLAQFSQTRNRTGPLVLDHQGLTAENNAGLSISLRSGYAGDAIPDLNGDA